MKYNLFEALLIIIISMLQNAPIVLVTIIVSIISIALLDKLKLIKQPKQKRK